MYSFEQLNALQAIHRANQAVLEASQLYFESGKIFPLFEARQEQRNALKLMHCAWTTPDAH